MNKAQRQAYSEKNVRRIKLFERQFLKPIVQLLQQQFTAAAKLIRAGQEQQLRNKTGVIPGLGAELQNLYNIVGVFYANQTLREINRQAREVKAGFGLNQEWIDLIKQYFQLYLLNKAVLPISATTYADIFAIITKGYQEGWSVDKMAFELEHSDMPVWRARMIVRTEILKAQNYGSALGEQESEWETTKEWVSADDDRVRNSHRRVDGVIVPSDGKFVVPKRKGGFDYMTGPGDPEGSAENVINCRCRTVVAPARDERGRLIRKRKISVLLPSDVAKTRRQVVTI